jgi:hypothetical protein
MNSISILVTKLSLEEFRLLFKDTHNIRKMYAKLIYSYFSGLMSMIKLIWVERHGANGGPPCKIKGTINHMHLEKEQAQILAPPLITACYNLILLLKSYFFIIFIFSSNYFYYCF